MSCNNFLLILHELSERAKRAHEVSEKVVFLLMLNFPPHMYRGRGEVVCACVCVCVCVSVVMKMLNNFWTVQAFTMKISGKLKLLTSNFLTKFGFCDPPRTDPGINWSFFLKIYLLPQFLSNLNGIWLILYLGPIRIKLTFKFLNFCPDPELWRIQDPTKSMVFRTLSRHHFRPFWLNWDPP